ATRTFNGNPSASDDTPLDIPVTADDGNGGTASAGFTLTLDTVNDAPVVANPIPDQTFTGAGNHSFAFASDTFTDADAADTLTYTATLSNGDPLPSWLSFDSATRTFSGNPSASDTTPLDILVTADDGNGGPASTGFT